MQVYDCRQLYQVQCFPFLLLFEMTAQRHQLEYVYLDVDFMTGYNVRSYLLLSITLTCIGLYLFWEIKSYGAVTLRPDTF